MKNKETDNEPVMVRRTQHVSWEYAKLSRVLKELPALIEKFGETAYLDIDFDYDDQSEICIRYLAEETEHERAVRLNSLASGKAYRRRQYEEMKKEFENE